MSDLHNTGAVCGKAKAPAAEKSTKRIQASKEREVINIYNPLNSSLSLRLG